MLVPLIVATSVLSVFSDSSDEELEEMWARAVLLKKPKVFVDFIVHRQMDVDTLRFAVRDWLCASGSLDELEKRALFGIPMLEAIPGCGPSWRTYYKKEDLLKDTADPEVLLQPAASRYEVSTPDIELLHYFSRNPLPTFGGPPSSSVFVPMDSNLRSVVGDEIADIYLKEGVVFYASNDLSDWFPGEGWDILSWDDNALLLAVNSGENMHFEKTERAWLREFVQPVG